MGREDHGESEVEELVTSVAVMIEKLEHPVVSDRCIYRAPASVRQINEAAYAPRVVSIGPFHCDDKRLKSMQQIKLIYLKSFLDSTGLTLESCLSKLKEWETKIRHSYAEEIQQTSDDFVRMILIDACFIFEHFLRCSILVDQFRETDPLLTNYGLLQDVTVDLTLLENQLPFFVLQGLYYLATCSCPDLPSFRDMAFGYFAGLILQNNSPHGMDVCHFTDLLRRFYISPKAKLKITSEFGMIERKYCASQLEEAGLEFEVNENSQSSFELKYIKGVLIMPRLAITNFTENFFRNILAFEQSHGIGQTYITDYLIILDTLINSEKDVDILMNKKIIANYFGDSKDVAALINRLGSGLRQLRVNKEYLDICKQLNDFYENPINKWKAGLIHDYFNTPVKAATSVTAILLIILTLVQTVCSIYPLVKDY